MATVITERAGTGGRSIDLVGGLKQRIVTVTGPASYVTGGDAVTAAMFGLTTIVAITDGISGGKILHYDPVNAKMQVLVCGASAAALAEVANASDQSAVIAPMIAIGS